MKFKIKAVMIDLDGTLIHTAPEIATAANEMLTSLGLQPLTATQIQGYIGEGALTLIKRCLTHTSTVEPDPVLVEKAQPLFFEAYARIVATSQPYPGIETALKSLKSIDVKLACVTNKPAAFTMPLLEKSGLLSYFDMVVSGDTLQKKKPDPDQILHICKHFAVPVSQSVLIGDSKTDIEASRNAGCYVFMVPYGYNQGYSIETHAADALIAQVGDAVDLMIV